MPRGGARPNSGPKKGFKFPATIEKEEARKALRAMVIANMHAMTDAQIANAQGIRHFMLRRDDGTFERSDDPEAIVKALNSGDETSFYIFTKDPSVQAYTDLMNRALDKPTEHVDLNVTSDDERVKRLTHARQRLAKLK